MISNDNSFSYIFQVPGNTRLPMAGRIAAGKTRILRWGRPTMTPYEVYVRPSGIDKFPCVGIERQGACPAMSSERSAELMDKPYEIVGGFLDDRDRSELE